MVSYLLVNYLSWTIWPGFVRKFFLIVFFFFVRSPVRAFVCCWRWPVCAKRAKWRNKIPEKKTYRESRRTCEQSGIETAEQERCRREWKATEVKNTVFDFQRFLLIMIGFFDLLPLYFPFAQNEPVYFVVPVSSTCLLSDAHTKLHIFWKIIYHWIDFGHLYYKRSRRGIEKSSSFATRPVICWYFIRLYLCVISCSPMENEKLIGFEGWRRNYRTIQDFIRGATNELREIASILLAKLKIQ